MVIKTLIIRGADIKTKTDKNETCIDLIPQNIMADEEK